MATMEVKCLRVFIFDLISEHSVLFMDYSAINVYVR